MVDYYYAPFQYELREGFAFDGESPPPWLKLLVLQVVLGFPLLSLLPRSGQLHSSHIRHFYNPAHLQGSKIRLYSQLLTWAEA